MSRKTIWLLCTLLMAWTSLATAETMDVIFVVDLSDSLANQWKVQFNGVEASIRDLRRDGSVAVAVMTLNADQSVLTEIPLTVLDSTTTVESICSQVGNLQGGDSDPTKAFGRAFQIFRTQARGVYRFLILSSDAHASGQPAYDAAQALRQAGVKICTVGIGGYSNNCPDSSGINNLKKYANTTDLIGVNLLEPIGTYSCIDPGGYPSICVR